MLKKTIIMFWLIFGLWALALAPGQPGVGSQAWDFTLESFDGEKVSLHDFSGKVVFLNFWASWCKPCGEEIPMLDMLQKVYMKEKFAVISVNVDNNKENALRFIEKHNIRVRSVWDKEKQVVASYDVETMPTSFILDGNGKIRYVHSGFKAEDYSRYKQEIENILGKKKRMKTKKRRPSRRQAYSEKR